MRYTSFGVFKNIGGFRGCVAVLEVARWNFLLGFGSSYVVLRIEVVRSRSLLFVVCREPTTLLGSTNFKIFKNAVSVVCRKHTTLFAAQNFKIFESVIFVVCRKHTTLLGSQIFKNFESAVSCSVS